MNPVSILPHYFLKIPFNNSLHSMPRSSKWSLPFRFSNQNLYTFFISPMHTHLLFLNLIMLIMSGEEYKLRSSSCSFLQLHVIVLITRFSDILTLCFSLRFKSNLMSSKWLGNSVLCCWFYLSFSVNVFSLGRRVILATAE